jgi:uncharacterized membrane protein
LGGGFWALRIGFLLFAPDVGPSTSALFVLVRDVNQVRVLPELSRHGGTVLRISLSADAEQRLKGAECRQRERCSNRHAAGG